MERPCSTTRSNFFERQEGDHKNRPSPSFRSLKGRLGGASAWVELENVNGSIEIHGAQ